MAIAESVREMVEFIQAYDKWALSREQCGDAEKPWFCGGPLFDAMLEARDRVNNNVIYRGSEDAKHAPREDRS